MPKRIAKQFNMEDHGLHAIRVGDVNGDGLMELIFAQAYPMNREICAITAVDLDGNVLWRHGEILDYCDYGYSDYPFQVFDWDGDGQQEVLFVRQTNYTKAKGFCYSKLHNIIVDNPSKETLRFNNHDFCPELALEYDGPAYMVVLDGSTGKIKEEIPIPATADDSFLFAHFDNTGKPNLLVKDRYWNMYALDHEGNVLWHLNKYEHQVFFGHAPAIGDIDGDGFDELFITDTLFDHDGSIIWKIPNIEGHHDTAYILDQLPEPVIVTIADKLRMIRANGEIIWEAPGGHLQFAYVGHLFNDKKYGPYQILTIDHAPATTSYEKGIELLQSGIEQGQKTTLYDFYGNVIWSERTDIQHRYELINWNGEYDCMIHYPHSGLIEIKDLEKGTVETITYPAKEVKLPGDFESYYLANCLGDARDEIILFGNDMVKIIMNTEAYNLRRHYNFSVYQPTL